MHIDKKFELVDAGHQKIEKVFDELSEEILTQIQPLRNLTGIGTNKKFSGMGIAWKYLKETLFKLIDDGVLKKEKRKLEEIEIESVDLTGLTQIEVS